jgi:hypothetical protein
MSYNNEMSDNENENVNIPTVEEEDQEFVLPPPPPLQRMNCQHVFYVTQETDQVDITVLNRQTNGPHPDCDLEFDAASSPQGPQEDPQEDVVPLVPTHPLNLGFFNFVDNRYSTFYNNVYNFIEPGIIQYTEEEDNTIKVIDLDELVMPAPCSTCYCFNCDC